ncbi:hypothetical protein L2U69_03760 [Zavarzinia compransoris]|uniref:hypothetical protein n=1 Tax=Zavarzinia marina TaxID=2911065 RepID=UPI001F261453|nr:hypothetical protein [Zavarzinia marina]MCF4164754.1 hypothetical protein [Zavarzinia marina]
MLTFRDYVLLTLLFLLVAAGVYFGAEWIERRMPRDGASPPGRVAVETRGTPAPASRPSSTSISPDAAMFFGDDGRMLAEVRGNMTRDCRSSIGRGPLGQALDRATIDNLCDCQVDWLESELRNGQFSLADMEAMVNGQSVPTEVDARFRASVERCMSR